MAAILAVWTFFRAISAVHWSLIFTVAVVGAAVLLSAPLERGLVVTAFLAVGLSCFHLGRSVTPSA